MSKLRTALLGAVAQALPLAAFAGSARAAEPAPMPVAFAAPFPAPDFFPDARLIAIENALFRQQDALFQHMMQDANQMLRASWPATPNGLVQAALRGGTGQATQMVMTTFSSGGNTCSETITYSYPGRGAASHMVVHKTGNACGALHVTDGGATQVALPAAPQETAPQPMPAAQGPQLLGVNDESVRPAPVHQAVWWSWN